LFVAVLQRNAREEWQFDASSRATHNRDDHPILPLLHYGRRVENPMRRGQFRIYLFAKLSVAYQ
jgi:hypothetical protein